MGRRRTIGARPEPQADGEERDVRDQVQRLRKIIEERSEPGANVGLHESSLSWLPFLRKRCNTTTPTLAKPWRTRGGPECERARLPHRPRAHRECRPAD